MVGRSRAFPWLFVCLQYGCFTFALVLSVASVFFIGFVVFSAWYVFSSKSFHLIILALAVL